MLDVECFTYLNALLESPMAPTVIFATNRGNSVVRGTDIVAPHGIPVDLLDRCVSSILSLTLLYVLTLCHRCLIVKTDGYSPEATAKVIQMRANVEGLHLGTDALSHLAQQGDNSLRYAHSPSIHPIILLIETTLHSGITYNYYHQLPFWRIYLDGKLLMYRISKR